LDPYQVLGVPRTATPAEIKAAWRALARAHHPDRNHGDPKAEARFKELQAAWAVLSDPAKRSAWDSGRRRPVDTSTPASPAPEIAPALWAAADRMLRFYLDEVLPRTMHRYQRGHGAEFVVRLLEDVETGQIRAAAKLPPPGRLTRVRAAQLAVRVRVEVHPQRVLERDRPVLARAVPNLEVGREGYGLVWRIVLWAGSFEALGYRKSDALDEPVLKAISLEMVRVLERDLPQPLRPIENTELRLPRPTVERARRADFERMVYVAGTRAAWVGILALIIVVVWRLRNDL
jgi:hypothetical protein